MIPQFFVFVEEDTSPQHLILIKGLLDLGYIPFVDNQKGNNEQWFKDNLKSCPHRLYRFDGEDVTGEIFGESVFQKPDLLVAFSEGVEVSEDDWALMNEFVFSFSVGIKMDSEEEEILLENVENVFKKPKKIEMEQKNKILTNTDLPKSYGFRFASVENVGFYEIVKPNVEEPYVTMVEDYKNFPMDMYTNFFKCTSWGVSNSDIAFMKKLWVHHGEAGYLNLEKEYEKRVQRVLDGGKEPLVWRNTLEHVIEIYHNAKDAKMKGKKREAEGMEIRNKK